MAQFALRLGGVLALFYSNYYRATYWSRDAEFRLAPTDGSTTRY